MAKNQINKQKIHDTKKTQNSKINSFEFISKYAIFILLFFTFLVHSQSLSFGFTGFDDDFLIYKNLKNLHDFSNIINVFTNNSFLTVKVYGFYRPLQTLSFMFDTWIGNGNPLVYHFINLLLHCLTTFSVFILFKKLKNNILISFSIALIFSIHPIFTHAVCWLPSRGDLLLGLFGILSFIYFIRYFEEKKSSNYFLHLIYFLLSILSKESALVLPFLYIIYFILTNNNIKKIFIFFPSWLVLMLSWFIFWKLSVKELPSSDIFGFVPFINNLRAIPEITYNFILPFQLASMPVYTMFASILGSILILAFIIFGFYSKEIDKQTYLFGLIWFIFLLIPGMFYNRNSGISDKFYDYLNHRAYLASIGLILSILEILKYYLKNVNIKQISKYYSIIVLTLIIATFIYAKSYSSPLDFFNDAIKTNTTSASAHILRGNIFRDNNELDSALLDYDEAIKLNPKDLEALCNSGSVKGMKNDLTGALSDFNKALKINPNLSDALYDRALIFNMNGDIKAAINDLNAVLKINPNDYKALIDRGNANSEIKEYSAALIDFNKAIAIKPNSVVSYYNRANIKSAMEDLKGAIDDYSKAIELKNNYGKAYLNRGNMRYRLNDKSGACSDWKAAM